jgi:hypothetical protein
MTMLGMLGMLGMFSRLGARSVSDSCMGEGRDHALHALHALQLESIASRRPPLTRKPPAANRHTDAHATSLRLAALSNASLPPTGSRPPFEHGEQGKQNQTIAVEESTSSEAIGHLAGHVTSVWRAHA